jgi:hypothetical protein
MNQSRARLQKLQVLRQLQKRASQEIDTALDQRSEEAVGPVAVGEQLADAHGGVSPLAPSC